MAAPTAEGFKAVRQLAERDGMSFFEGACSPSAFSSRDSSSISAICHSRPARVLPSLRQVIYADGHRTEGTGADVYWQAIARAAGVSLARIEALVAARGSALCQASPEFFAFDQAVASVRAFRAARRPRRCTSFDPPAFAHAPARLPVAVSSAAFTPVSPRLVVISTIGSPEAARLGSEQRIDRRRVSCFCNARPRGRWRRRGSSSTGTAATQSVKARPSSTARFPSAKRRSLSRRRLPPEPPPQKPGTTAANHCAGGHCCGQRCDILESFDTPAPAQSESRGRGTAALGSGDGLVSAAARRLGHRPDPRRMGVALIVPEAGLRRRQS